MIGVLGGFSTFSAFSDETLVLLQNRDYLLALLNVVLNVSVSLAAVAIGLLVTSGLPVREAGK